MLGKTPSVNQDRIRVMLRGRLIIAALFLLLVAAVSYWGIGAFAGFCIGSLTAVAVAAIHEALDRNAR